MILNFTKPHRCFILILTILSFFPIRSFAQKLHFKNYTINEGLCHPFVYNIAQDKNGFIWLGTGEGLCRFDGFEFISSNSFDTLPLDVVNVSFVDSLGKLWFGFNNGEVWSYDGNYFLSHNLPIEGNISITGITQSDEKGILIATQNKGIFLFDSKGSVKPFHPSFEGKLLTTIHASRNMLLAGSQEGLVFYDMDGTSQEIQNIEELDYMRIQVIKDAYSGNSFWIGTESDGLYFLRFLNDSYELRKVGKDFDIGYEKIQDIAYGYDSSIYVCTFTSGLLKLIPDKSRPGEINSVERSEISDGLSTSYVKCVFPDREGNIWMGTYGSGISMQKRLSFNFYDLEKRGFGKSVNSLAENDSILWIGGDDGILKFFRKSGKSVLYSRNGLPSDRITTLCHYDGNLWVGTETSGIYKYDGYGSFIRFFYADNSIGNSINYLTADEENLYAATKDGIYFIDKSSRKAVQYNTMNGLPHNKIEHIFIDSENRLLFATSTNGIYEINVKGEVQQYATVGRYELDFNSITQDPSGNIWAGTYGQGVFLITPDSIINFTENEGLKSPYCYSIISDDSSFVWVGHRLGLSRIDINSLRISVFDDDNGITGDFNRNAVILSGDNLLYFGSTDGLIAYNTKESYQKRPPPQGNILRVFISDKEYDFRKPIILPYAAYKLRIEYIGLNYNDPNGVTYRYKLDGYDLDWSDVTSSRGALYPRVEDGEYTFLLKAIDMDGQVSGIPVKFTIKVKLPFWKTWWFISLAGIILIGGIIIIVKVRERKQKEIQEYLEQRLDERTREVVEQKEVIEIKNKDITDSITYAQRIQTSILPPIKRLQQHFAGSFIFYQPRDIVSGDFYWFDKVNESKFIIVCADSTGHGVPGAFMSMIGTTLIKDVCLRSDIKGPSDILFILDQELRNILNQNIDVEQSNDGMDIIVCEIDIRTNYLRYASAMRPMIVYRGGEQIYVKGSRSSVGGQYEKIDKLFKDEGVQLDKGDLLYMFSDGYPDQFGGSVGKKFKMVRLKNLLHDIHQKPMEEQYEYVKSTFNLWKEDFEQVDDVLFMGIKI